MIHRFLALLLLSSTLWSVTACDDGEEAPTGPLVEAYGRLLPPVPLGDGLLVSWGSGGEIDFRANGMRVDARGRGTGLGQLARTVDLLQDAWPVSAADGGAFVVSVQFGDAGPPHTVRVRPIGADGTVDDVREHPVATVPAAFGRIDERLTLLRPDADALVLERFDGEGWGQQTILDAAPCGCHYDLREVGGQPVVITRTATRLTVDIFDGETGEALGRHEIPASLSIGNIQPLDALATAETADGLRVVWVDRELRPFKARAMTVGADGALVDAPADLVELSGTRPAVALSPDGAHFGWSVWRGVAVAPFDALDAQVARFELEGEDPQLYLAAVGGQLQALTATYVEEGETYQMVVELRPVPVEP